MFLLVGAETLTIGFNERSKYLKKTAQLQRRRFHLLFGQLKTEKLETIEKSIIK